MRCVGADLDLQDRLKGLVRAVGQKVVGCSTAVADLDLTGSTVLCVLCAMKWGAAAQLWQLLQGRAA
jgi:hypothetical protein